MPPTPPVHHAMSNEEKRSRKTLLIAGRVVCDSMPMIQRLGGLTWLVSLTLLVLYCDSLNRRSDFVCREEELEYESHAPLNEIGSNEEQHALLFLGNNGREERHATVEVPRAFGAGKFNDEVPVNRRYQISPSHCSLSAKCKERSMFPYSILISRWEGIVC